MLEMFRNAGKSWVAKILLMLLAGSFGVWGIQDIFGGFNATALATVGNQEISSQQYSNFLPAGHAEPGPADRTEPDG